MGYRSDRRLGLFARTLVRGHTHLSVNVFRRRSEARKRKLDIRRASGELQSHSVWYGQIDPAISYDWTAETENAWVLPIGADVGKAFNLGSQGMSLQIGSYDFVKHPDAAAQWMIRVQLTLLFPSGWTANR
jgi:hypothetical protein